VEITVEEAVLPDFILGTGDWNAAEKAVGEINDFDFGAIAAQDECDLNDAKAQSP